MQRYDPYGVLCGGVNFIRKPFSMKDLAIKVRDILDDAAAIFVITSEDIRRSGEGD